MTWGEFAGAVFLGILIVYGVAALRIRASDRKIMHAVFGLSREENARRGLLVSLMGAVAVVGVDPSFVHQHPLAGVGWAIALVFFLWRWWSAKRLRELGGSSSRRPSG